MPPIANDGALDATLALLSEGYLFISNRCRQLQTDVFETRLMLRRVTCVLGAEAARMFYEPGRFTRRGAMPPTTLRLLQGKGSVQTLDGAAHRRRKAMFMELMTPEAIGRLDALFAEEWRGGIERWARSGPVALHDAAQEVLLRAVCRWTGVTLREAEAARRTREMAAMIDGAGSVGPRMWKGWLLRRRTERWLREVIAGSRARSESAEGGDPLHAIATHRDEDGRLLDPRTAVYELLNLLRPTVAIARFITFAALALHEHPEWRERIVAEGDEARLWFVQEIRRFYPFFPVTAGRVLQPFEWRGRRFRRNDWVMLDLYGTNHDARIWGDPEAFRPERFGGREAGKFDLIPQGGGEYDQNHRCAGEWITLALLKTAVGLLTTEMDYSVPRQELGIDLARMPAIAASGFVIADVRRVK